MFKPNQHKKGLSLIETLIVVVLASFVIVVVVNLFLIYGNVFNTSKAITRINGSASTALERMTREIKLANNVDTGLSILDLHPGKLVLNTTSGSTPSIVEFYLDNTVLMMKQDSVIVGALTKSDVSIDRLVFSFVNNGTSQLVMMEMNLSTETSSSTRSASFRTSSVLRGSY